METGEETLTVAHSIRRCITANRSVDAYRLEIDPSTATATATEVVGVERTGLPVDGDEEMEMERPSMARWLTGVAASRRQMTVKESKMETETETIEW
ncbi:hypothetical protein ACLOJK_039497 [Asimina triloba]